MLRRFFRKKWVRAAREAIRVRGVLSQSSSPSCPPPPHQLGDPPSSWQATRPQLPVLPFPALDQPGRVTCTTPSTWVDSDEQLKVLLESLFTPGLTLLRVREALEAFVPERLLPAVIQAHRAATLVPAELVLLKFEKHVLVDHLLPDPKPDIHEHPKDAGNPPVCEECARAVEEPDQRWCSDCAQRVFHGLPNSRDPQP